MPFLYVVHKVIFIFFAESDTDIDFGFERFKSKKRLKRKQRLALISGRIESPIFLVDQSPCTSSNESFSLWTNRDREETG